MHGRVLAIAGRGQATICCARISVVAAEQGRRAIAGHAMVIEGAAIIVAARSGLGEVLATVAGDTAIGRAGIIVAATICYSYAFVDDAMIQLGTRVAIIARAAPLGGVDAAGDGQTGVLGAAVGVVAANKCSATSGYAALVVDGAEVAVVARPAARRVRAGAGKGKARVFGTDLPVIAVLDEAPGALTGGAVFALRAGVAVGAGDVLS